MATPNQFINNISQFNPSTNVNDENMNVPLQELLSNQNFLLSLLTNSSASAPGFLSTLYGNYLDYDQNGNKVFFNGGNMDCFQKKNAWLAINDGAGTNDTDIQQTDAADLLIYRGGVSFIDGSGEQHGIWLQRQFYIPPLLRGSQMVFAIKGTGVNTDLSQTVNFDYNIPYCNVSTIPNISAVGLAGCTPPTTAMPASGTCIPELSGGCYGRYEDIGVEVLNAQGTVQQVMTLGPWPHHPFYAPENDWLPQFRTGMVVFTVGQNTSVITIRIRRTRADGAIAISQMFLGGLPVPISNYNIEHLDINELYNFNLGITKWNTTTVDGRHVAQDASTSQLPNILTKEQWLHLSQFNRNIEEYDWDQENGPRLTELQFSTLTGAPSSNPVANVFEFDPNVQRFLHYDMRIDGPDPGMCYLGVSYFVNENEFSGTISCSGVSGSQVCGDISFNVSVAIVNTGQFGNPTPTQYTTWTYDVPIQTSVLPGNMGYFEIYGDFYNKLTSGRGAIAYFTISRNGTDPNDTFEGNFLLVGMKTGIAVPPDDLPSPGIYPNLFIGNNNSC